MKPSLVVAVATFAALFVCAGCGLSAQIGDAGATEAGCKEGEPSSSMVCFQADDAGCTLMDATCCGGIPTCPDDGLRLVPSDAIPWDGGTCIDFPLSVCR